MLRRIGRSCLKYGPALALGLFVGRLLGESIPGLTGKSLAVVITTATTVAVAIVAMRLIPLSQTWPILFLTFYVVSPEPSPVSAVFTLLTIIFIYSYQIKRRPQPTISASLLALILLILYGVTLATDVLPADNGELQLIATKLGVAHPPGFSLYTLLAHLSTRVPIGASAAYKVNLFSSLISALTLFVVFLTVHRLTHNQGGAITAVIALGTSTTFWAQATLANIRSMTALFAALMLYTLVRFQEESRNENQLNKDRWLTLFALALGFGITHHASLAFMGLVFVAFILLVDPSLLKNPKRGYRPLLAGSLGLLPLLYFPLRAGADVRGASEGLASMSGFLNHVLALGFRGDLFHFIEPAILWQRFQVMGNVLTFQFSDWLLVGMGVGFLYLLWHDKKLAFLLGGSFALHTFITATYRAPQTVEYMLPAYLPLVLTLGYLINENNQMLKRHSSQVTAVLGAVLLVAALRQGWQNYPSFAFLHQDSSTRTYVGTLLEQAPADSVILADWHWATPLWYLREVENQRPDVTIKYVFPEGESYAATWARRIEKEFNDGRFVIATHFDETAYAGLPTPEPLGDAYLFRGQPRTTLPKDFSPLNLTLTGDILLLGYHFEGDSTEIGQETTITIAWQAIAVKPGPVTLFAHLIDADGRLFAQDDLQIQPQPDGITLTQFRLTPRLGAVPGDYDLLIGTPADGDNRLPIGSITVTAMQLPPVTLNQVYRTIAGERPFLRLIGYDWDNTLPDQSRLYLHWQTEHGYHTEIRDNPTSDTRTLPDYIGHWGVVFRNTRLTIDPNARKWDSQSYIPFGQGIVWTGERNKLLSTSSTFDLPQTLHSSRPVLQDFVLSVRLIGYEDDGYHWAWWELDDSIPAMGAIPTLKWIAGSTTRSPHILAVDPAVQPGQRIGATLRVYDAFTNRPLPILDDRITNDLQLPWVPLGQNNYRP